MFYNARTANIDLQCDRAASAQRHWAAARHSVCGTHKHWIYDDTIKHNLTITWLWLAHNCRRPSLKNWLVNFYAAAKHQGYSENQHNWSLASTITCTHVYHSQKLTQNKSTISWYQKLAQQMFQITILSYVGTWVSQERNCTWQLK